MLALKLDFCFPCLTQLFFAFYFYNFIREEPTLVLSLVSNEFTSLLFVKVRGIHGQFRSEIHQSR